MIGFNAIETCQCVDSAILDTSVIGKKAQGQPYWLTSAGAQPHLMHDFSSIHHLLFYYI